MSNYHKVYKNGYFLLYDRCTGQYLECVSCGKPLEHDLKTECNIHKCSNMHIARREAADTRAWEDGIVGAREHPFWEKLQDGFRMMKMSDANDAYFWID